MILAKLTDSTRYEGMHPSFRRAFEYIRTTDFSALPASRIELDGDRLFINVCETELVPAETQKLEVHRSYIDIHVPLLQTETIGWKHLSDLAESEAPFDEQGDFASMPTLRYYTSLCNLASFLLYGPRMLTLP